MALRMTGMYDNEGSLFGYDCLVRLRTVLKTGQGDCRRYKLCHSV